MNWYIQWVTENPVLSAAIQFGILGTFGEFISHFMRTKKFALFCTPLQLLEKIIAWAILGIIIKYGFTGMKGFVANLLTHNLLPQFCSYGIGLAFSISVFTNILFGPQMMFFHRIEDNIILHRKDFDGLKKAWWTLIWFWIPAHTITFSLPVEFQIGLAALWSIALGIILGLTSQKKSSSSK